MSPNVAIVVRGHFFKRMTMLFTNPYYPKPPAKLKLKFGAIA